MISGHRPSTWFPSTCFHAVQPSTTIRPSVARIGGATRTFATGTCGKTDACHCTASRKASSGLKTMPPRANSFPDRQTTVQESQPLRTQRGQPLGAVWPTNEELYLPCLRQGVPAGVRADDKRWSGRVVAPLTLPPTSIYHRPVSREQSTAAIDRF